jgi:hypothetical protein
MNDEIIIDGITYVKKEYNEVNICNCCGNKFKEPTYVNFIEVEYYYNDGYDAITEDKKCYCSIECFVKDFENGSRMISDELITIRSSYKYINKIVEKLRGEMK